MHPMLSKDVALRRVGNAVTAASNTDSDSTRIDMSGYEGVMFFVTITDSVAGGVASLKVEENTIDSDTGMTALTGALATLTSAVDDDINGKVLMVDVYRPRERYVQGVRVSATQNIAFGECYAVLYGAKTLPVTADSTIGAAAAVVSPSE